MKTTTLALALGSLLVGSLASAAPGERMQMVARTAHLSVFAHGRANPDARKIEDTLVAIGRQLGAGELAPAQLHSYETAGEISVVTGQYASGITYPARREVYTTARSTRHELVHLVAGQLGDPGPFFHEGLAVVMGDKATYRGRDVDSVARPYVRRAPLATLMSRFNVEDIGDGYAIAGSFVKYLIEHHGLARVAGFFRACRTQRVPAAFTSTFGSSMDAVGAAWASQLQS